MSFTVPIYVTPLPDGRQEWTTLGLGAQTTSRQGASELKLQQGLINDLKQIVRKLDPADLDHLELKTGVRLDRLRLDLTLRGEGGKRKLTGLFPVILEPRWFNRQTRALLVYHPARQQEWFPLEDEAELEERAALYFSRVWEPLEESEIHELQSGGKDRLRVLSFSTELKTVLDKLPQRKGGLWDDLRVDPFRKGDPKPAGGAKLLRELGLDLTQRASDLSLSLGMPRSPYREQLQLLLVGDGRRSTIVVGPPQVGKTTLINTAVADLLEADGYWAHRNLDKVHHVFSLSGQRIIAGMAYVGDWEQRCMELLEEAAGKRVLLAVEDLAAWGRLGRSRESDRNLAELFRGPLARGELTMIGECTPEQLARLEDDAPSFAAQFSRVHVSETTASETLRMLLAEARSLELAHDVAFDPLLWRHLIELAGSLLSSAAFPGKALELLRELDRDARRSLPAGGEGGARVQVGSDELLALLSQRTGLPDAMLRLDEELDPEELRLDFERQVMGQPEAVNAACDLVMRLRTGLTEPKRPCAVYLFTGPTGTGKTELAKCIAEYLYGEASRLVRFDMGEYSDGGAPGRLAGDLWQPRGILTDGLLQQPFCVVLFDEVEKAHPSVLHLMLQIFDEGRLTDAAGSTADFTHAVVIMTSNLGSRLQPPAGFAEGDEPGSDDALRAVREFFPPELYNRIDRVLRFRPLGREAARQIAQKELAALLGRRGLSDRNIFVYPSGRVLDRVVEGGFDPLLGARPLKRYLEREVGSLLAEHVSSAPGTLMQIVRLHIDERASRGGFQLHAETLAEAQPVAGELPLEPLLGLPVRELRTLLPGALDFLDRLLASDQLEQLTGRISFHLNEHERGGAGQEAHADALYNLESMRSQLRGLRGRIGFFHGRAGQRADRRAMLRALAEAQFLRRALETVEDPGQHAVLIELLHLGLARRQQRFGETGAALMEALALSYLEQRVVLEGWAARAADGTILESTAKLEAATLRKRPEQLVLKLVGLGALDFFGGENGCHVWRSLGHGSDVLRVRVWSAGESSAKGVILDHLRALQRFEAALEAGAPLPENPERLLPLVREYRFDPPAPRCKKACPTGCKQIREGTPLEIADYALGYATTLRVRRLGEGLPHLWLLRMGRKDADESWQRAFAEPGRVPAEDEAPEDEAPEAGS